MSDTDVCSADAVVCSAPPFVPYKPVPRLVPLPDKHTLVVARPESQEAASFGHLRNDNLQLIVTAQVGQHLSWTGVLIWVIQAA
jgi:hypothetical protein